MKNHQELLELLPDGELGFVSAEFFVNYTGKVGEAPADSQEILEIKLRAFQNGWLACKQFYEV